VVSASVGDGYALVLTYMPKYFGSCTAYKNAEGKEANNGTAVRRKKEDKCSFGGWLGIDASQSLWC
jgi:hypothetical protein